MSDARIPAQLPPHPSWDLSLQLIQLIRLHPFKNSWKTNQKLLPGSRTTPGQVRPDQVTGVP